MTTAGSDRRRRAQRLPVSAEGRLEGRVPSAVALMDLSLTGCLVRAPRALEPGAIFDLRVPLEGFELLGKVRVADCSLDGTSAGAAPSWLSGLEFLALPVEQGERLRQYLDRRRRPGADSPAR